MNKIFRYLKNNAELGDTFIECRDGRVTCHSLLFSAASPSWKNVLDVKSEQITISIPDVSRSEVNLLMDILYTCKGELTMSDCEKTDRKVLKQILPDFEKKIEDLDPKDKIVDEDLTCKICF